ncbi:hypothetical protein ACWGSK_20745 [Nocardiopsis sp. NPDC055551]
MPIADPGAGAATPAPPVDVETQKLSLEDGDGIINPLTFPEPSVSVGYVEAMASGLRELGTSIADTGNDITGSWAGLSAHYSAPEAETLFSVLDPVATDGDTVGEELDRAARALENFAEDVADIKTRWSNLRVEAYDLRSRILAKGDDWRKAEDTWDRIVGNDSPLVEENAALIEQGGKIITDYTEVENTCANAINAGISGRTQFEQQPEGDAELDPNVFYHGFEQDLSELAEAWGHESAQTDHGWWVDVGHSVWDFGVDAVQGVGAMVGAHSSEGWFQASWGDALKEYHWDNLTSAASLVGMYDAESDSLGWNGGEGVGEAWKDLAHSVVPWEEWGDRPGYVIGTAALNVIGLVGGAALTATGVGAVVGVPLMAWRGMSIMDGMGGSGRGGGSGVDIDVPDVSHVPQFGGSGSPLINLAGRALDATGFGPSQLADFKAMVNRLMPSGQHGVEPAGAAPPQPAGEVSGSAGGSAHTVGETDQRSIRRPAQGSATADASGNHMAAAGDVKVSVAGDIGEADGGRSGGARPVQANAEADQRSNQRPAQDPTVGDALVGDDILNHPDLAEIDNKTKSDPAAQRDLATVDRDRASSRPEIPFSPEVREASGASSQSTDDSLSRVEDNDQNRDPNAGKALATVGAGHSPDTLRASAFRNTSTFPEPMWLSGSNEFGGGRPFGNEIADAPGSRNTDMRDNNPVVRNQDGDGSSPARSRSSETSQVGRFEVSNPGGGPSSDGNHTGNQSTGGTSQTPNSTQAGFGRSAFHSQEPLSVDWKKTQSIVERGLAGPGVNDGARPLLPESELTKKNIEKKDSGFSPGLRERFGDGDPLSPNTKYVVEDVKGNDRGIYVTDGDGEIGRIEISVKDFSQKHPEFKDPRPNVEYQIKTPNSDYTYETNLRSRNLESEGQFTNAKAPRMKGEEDSVKKAAKDYFDAYNKMLKEDFSRNPDKYPGLTEAPQYESVTWNGGHVVGIGEFGGIPERLNQVAMLQRVNQHSAAEWRVSESYRNFEGGMDHILKGDFDRLYERAKDFASGRSRDEYLARVKLWEKAYELSPPPPDIRARVSQIYDPSLPEFEVRNKNGSLARILDAPPVAVVLHYSINGVPQGVVQYKNHPNIK